MAPAHVRGRRRAEEIVRALTNAVTADRLAHAYLFSGPRGVGKTTTARLLAAAINCNNSDRPTATPCGTCASCTEVLEGRSIDTLEIDGATHGKVDQARDLIEIVSYAPSRDRRKVFIIDEVHAISSAAFQALLKTLEEPPAHAVFILATTERHKIPATILSRCQRFDFRRLTDDEVADRLADVAGREGFAVVESASVAKKGAPFVERPALGALAAAATGSLRDGLSLFDQAAARSGGSVTAADVAALLGAPTARRSSRSSRPSSRATVLASSRAARSSTPPGPIRGRRSTTSRRSSAGRSASRRIRTPSRRRAFPRTARSASPGSRASRRTRRSCASSRSSRSPTARSAGPTSPRSPSRCSSCVSRSCRSSSGSKNFFLVREAPAAPASSGAGGAGGRWQGDFLRK